MDTKLGIETMPAHEDSDEVWRQWATDYPTVRAINMLCSELTDGSATFALDDAAFPLNPNGAVNGGMVALAADQVMGVLAARTAPPGSVPVTAVLNVQFHSPAYPPLTFDAWVIPGGRFVQAIEVVARDVSGRRCSTATGTMAVGSPNRRADIGA
jgi:uncharacterized protein (TIGR00369 family)